MNKIVSNSIHTIQSDPMRVYGNQLKSLTQKVEGFKRGLHSLMKHEAEVVAELEQLQVVQVISDTLEDFKRSSEMYDLQPIAEDLEKLTAPKTLKRYKVEELRDLQKQVGETFPKLEYCLEAIKSPNIKLPRKERDHSLNRRIQRIAEAEYDRRLTYAENLFKTCEAKKFTIPEDIKDMIEKLVRDIDSSYQAVLEAQAVAQDLAAKAK